MRGHFALSALLLVGIGLVVMLQPTPGVRSSAAASKNVDPTQIAEAAKAETAAEANTAADTTDYVNNPDNFDPETGYRIKRYRAPVPATVDGAKTILSDDVEAFVAASSAVLIDVMPSHGAGPDAKTGVWRLSRGRQNIPGSTWLPDVGEGRLSPRMESYFKSNLARLTGGDPSKAIVIYCQADCWMGWNAAKRAAGWGYRNLHWYIEGTDGWRDWNGTFEQATPVPLRPAAEKPTADEAPKALR